MLAYYGTKISPSQVETAEGYLICRGVPIARTGVQLYAARELGLEGDPERIVPVERRPEDVFEAAALASFEGKPVTDGHPPENVGPENFSSYARGHVQNVRREGDMVAADLYINDAVLASQVRCGSKREISCGYLCAYVPHGDGYRQANIRGNHVAVVPRGRAGHEVAIKDAAQEAEKGRKYMSEFWKSFLTAFGMAAKDASPEEVQAMADTTAAALDAQPAAKAAEGPPAAQEPAQDASPSLDEKLDRILEALAALKPKEEKPAGDALDKLERELSGQREDQVVPAGGQEDACSAPVARDAALAIIKGLRPVVAELQDKEVQARITGALLSAVKGPDVMGAIDQAARFSAQRAADAAGRTSYEQRCADSEAAYAARNPHKRAEKEA